MSYGKSLNNTLAGLVWEQFKSAGGTGMSDREKTALQLAETFFPHCTNGPDPKTEWAYKRILDALDSLAVESKPLDPEIKAVVQENFWELAGKPAVEPGVRERMNELKPCPFCGAVLVHGLGKKEKVTSQYWHDSNATVQKYRVWCPHGCFNFGCDTKESAFAKANTRSIMGGKE